MAGARFKEFLKKYGKVAIGVHCSVSAASVTGLYIAIKNNVDVESMLEKVGLRGLSTTAKDEPEISQSSPEMTTDGFIIEDQAKKKRNRTAELAASSGGALALAILVNKVLFPIRVPITIAFTPPIARFLARRRVIKNSQ